eukprot:NODE_7680_length_1558_cov_4.523410.p1 GENE.NODE_7680_length_1558_cov_4.523410~~NODE_7680_length_1558_cov_4.523410.p1  ORF type:complete len:359 (+),score=106.10 NODE_7680_length_1558_cov_4.523410:117-1079(+)
MLFDVDRTPSVLEAFFAPSALRTLGARVAALRVEKSANVLPESALATCPEVAQEIESLEIIEEPEPVLKAQSSAAACESTPAPSPTPPASDAALPDLDLAATGTCSPAIHSCESLDGSSTKVFKTINIEDPWLELEAAERNILKASGRATVAAPPPCCAACRAELCEMRELLQVAFMPVRRLFADMRGQLSKQEHRLAELEAEMDSQPAELEEWRRFVDKRDLLERAVLPPVATLCPPSPPSMLPFSLCCVDAAAPPPTVEDVPIGALPSRTDGHIFGADLVVPIACITDSSARANQSFKQFETTDEVAALSDAEPSVFT